MPPRTIDNLGMEAYTRYAQDEQEREEYLIKEAHIIPNQTGIDVSLPSFPSESDLLLNSEPTRTPWASFVPPDHFFEQKGQVFSHQLMPRLGTEEKQESLIQKIAAKSQALADKATPSKEFEDSHPEPWMREKERAEQEQEKNKLTSLFTTVGSLDKIVIAVNSGRGQYHRG